MLEAYETYYFDNIAIETDELIYVVDLKYLWQMEVIEEKRQELLEWLRMSGPAVKFRRRPPRHPLLELLVREHPIRAPCRENAVRKYPPRECQ